MGWDLHPWEEAEKEERSLHSGSALGGRYQPPGQKESFRGSEESATTSLQQAEQREPCRGGLHHYLHAPAREPHPLAQAGWNSGFRGHPRRGLLLAVQRQPEGTRVHYGYNPAWVGGGSGMGPYLQKSRPSIGAKYCC